MSELKPCPFCGSKKVGCYESWTHWACQCDECGATMVKRGSKEEANEAWNTRTERTCNLIEQWTDKGTAFGTDEFLGYKCSECGYDLIDTHDKYCSECGAKVVGE